jgi:phospholipid-binding lipoprotein MlaA
MTFPLNTRSQRVAIFLLLAVGCLSGCASTTTSASEESPETNDPFETFNRSMFAVNRFGDRVIYKPVGKAYKTVIPNFARRGVGNFFDNLKTPRSSMNNFLQGKPGRGFNELGRFIFNTTIGVGGLFNVAAAGGMQRYDEDFSQTLAVWGLPEGPYLVIPIWGPRTILSTVALPVDIYTDLQLHFGNTGTRDKLYALRVIDARARLLTTEAIFMKSHDPYIAFREASLQYREFVIHDGDPPVDDDFYFFDEDE